MTDLAGASSAELYDTLFDRQTGESSSKINPSVTYLVSPFSMIATLPIELATCLDMIHRVFPHLDMDHLGESADVDWKHGLSLDVWTVNQQCLTKDERGGSKNGDTL